MSRRKLLGVLALVLVVLMVIPSTRTFIVTTTKEVLREEGYLPEDTSIVEGEKYNREKHFGEAWLDVDNNGCNTRDDIIKRDLTAVELVKRGTCSVPHAGILNDNYSGETINFLKGTGKGKDGGIQIDHIVPLSIAWGRGAQEWSQEERIEFANDPDNLEAVKSAENLSKSDSTPDEWLPSNTEYHCTYVTNYLKVMDKWKLDVTDAERKLGVTLCE